MWDRPSRRQAHPDTKGADVEQRVNQCGIGYHLTLLRDLAAIIHVARRPYRPRRCEPRRDCRRLPIVREWERRPPVRLWADMRAAMPTVAGIALAPLMQWLILPPLIIWLARRHIDVDCYRR